MLVSDAELLSQLIHNVNGYMHNWCNNCAFRLYVVVIADFYK